MAPAYQMGMAPDKGRSWEITDMKSKSVSGHYTIWISTSQKKSEVRSKSRPMFPCHISELSQACLSVLSTSSRRHEIGWNHDRGSWLYPCHCFTLGHIPSSAFLNKLSLGADDFYFLFEIVYVFACVQKQNHGRGRGPETLTPASVSCPVLLWLLPALNTAI